MHYLWFAYTKSSFREGICRSSHLNPEPSSCSAGHSVGYSVRLVSWADLVCPLNIASDTRHATDFDMIFFRFVVSLYILVLIPSVVQFGRWSFLPPEKARFYHRTSDPSPQVESVDPVDSPNASVARTSVTTKTQLSSTGEEQYHARSRAQLRPLDPQQEARPCCRAFSARCMACVAGQSVEEYCRSNTDRPLPLVGCEEFLSEGGEPPLYEGGGRPLSEGGGPLSEAGHSPREEEVDHSPREVGHSPREVDHSPREVEAGHSPRVEGGGPPLSAGGDRPVRISPPDEGGPLSEGSISPPREDRVCCEALIRIANSSPPLK